jgi:polyisoprenyl-phosphate glycosyltransferase
MSDKLDIIIPIYNEKNGIQSLVKSLSALLDDTTYEYSIRFVDDGSTDKSWKEISTAASNFDRVMGLRLSRNFGKDAALFAGIKKSDADLVITIDADGQHPIEYIPKILKLYEKTGAAVINGVKRERADKSLLYKFLAFIFNFLFFRASGLEVRNSSDFKLLNSQAKKELLKCKDHNIFYRALCNWIGLRQASFEFDVADRIGDSQSWNMKSLMRFAVNAFIYHSNLPIRMILWMGAVVLAVSVYLILALVWHIVFGTVEEGYPTIILLLLMNSGLSLTAIGIVGLYMRSTLDQTTQRPQYIIEDEC